MTKFIDNPIADRIRIITMDKDPIHVYEVMSKHYGESIELLKERFSIELDITKRRIFFNSKDPAEISELLNYLCNYGIDIESANLSTLRLDLDAFFKTIY